MGGTIYTYVGAFVQVPKMEHTIKIPTYRCSKVLCENHKFMDKKK